MQDSESARVQKQIEIVVMLNPIRVLISYAHPSCSRSSVLRGCADLQTADPVQSYNSYEGAGDTDFEQD